MIEAFKYQTLDVTKCESYKLVHSNSLVQVSLDFYPQPISICRKLENIYVSEEEEKKRHLKNLN